MTALVQDSHTQCGNARWSEAAKTLGDTELLYADDTLLLDGLEIFSNKNQHRFFSYKHDPSVPTSRTYVAWTWAPIQPTVGQQGLKERNKVIIDNCT